MNAPIKIPQHNTPQGTWCRFSGCDSKTGVCHLCKPVIPGLSDRAAAALIALASQSGPVMGARLATLMQALGRATTPAAAHQAGANLAHKGFATKGIPPGFYVRYVITDAGRALLAEHARHTCGPTRTGVAACPGCRAGRPVPLCGRCKRHPVAAPDATRADGKPSDRARYCDPCIDRCHEATDFAHICVICASPDEIARGLV